MKSRWSLILGAFAVLFATIWVVRDHNNVAPTTATIAALPLYARLSNWRSISNSSPPASAPFPAPKLDAVATPSPLLVKASPKTAH